MKERILELLHSNVKEDVLLGILMDTDYVISLMRNLHTNNEFWMKEYEFHSRVGDFHWLKTGNILIGFRIGEFIGLINPKKEDYYREHHDKLIYEG